MKKLTILLFSILISFNSYGGWFSSDNGLKKVTKAFNNTFYIDTSTIKEHNGYVYWWTLEDYLVPDSFGTMSRKVYTQGDCSKFLTKNLKSIWYSESMGAGVGEEIKSIGIWGLYGKDTVRDIEMNYVCDYVD